MKLCIPMFLTIFLWCSLQCHKLNTFMLDDTLRALQEHNITNFLRTLLRAYCDNKCNLINIRRTITQLRYPRKQYSLRQKYKSQPTEPQLNTLYLIDTRGTIVTLTINYISDLGYMEPRAVNIFLVEKLSSDIYHFLRSRYIFRAIIIQTDVEGYPMTNCHGEKLEMKNIADLHPFGVKRILKSHKPLTVSFGQMDFFTTLFKGKGKGIELELVDIIAKQLHIPVKYIERKNFNRFTKKDGKYYGAWFDLLTKQIDVIIGAPFFSEGAESDFDATVPYYVDTLHFVVPKSKVIYPIVGPYEPAVWYMYIITIISVLMMNTIIKFAEHRLRSTVQNMFIIISVFMEQPIKFDTRWPKRVLLTFIIVFVFLFNSAAKSKLIYFLTGNMYRHQIDTLEEIMKEGLTIAFFEKPELISLDSEIAQYAKDHSISCFEHEAFVSRTICLEYNRGRQYEHIAAIKPYTVIVHNAQFFLTSDFMPTVHFVGNGLRSVYSKMFFTRGHPLYSVFNYYLLQCVEGGLVQRMTYSNYWHRAWIAANKDSVKYQTHHVALGIKQLNRIFRYYEIGIAVSVLVFLLEILVHKLIKIW